jgi:hypothetical protein
MNQKEVAVFKRLVALLVLSLSLLSYATQSEAQHKKKQKVPCVATLTDCLKKAAGCGGDPALNVLKNQTTEASNPEEWTVQDVIDLEEEIPVDWRPGMNRQPLTDMGEGTAVTITGYLIHAKASSPEACNCGLPGEENNDFHLNLTAAKNDTRDDGIVAEITPRFRPSGWTLAKLERLADKKTLVRMTGWLMLDSQHLSGNGGPRATVWEVHPVTACDVCTSSVKKCKAGTGWKPLASIP